LHNNKVKKIKVKVSQVCLFQDI